MSELLFEHGIDVVNRRIFLFGDIDEKSADHVIKGIYSLSKRKTPLTLIINSDGGDIFQALAIYDIMKMSNCPIYTVGVGQIMSAAVLILAAGNKRYIGRHTNFMTHDISLSDYPDTKLATFRKEIKYLTNLRHSFFTALAKNSKLNVMSWEEKAKDGADYFFDAKTAIEYGIADKFLPEKSI